VRVGVLVVLRPEETARLAQRLHDLGVRVLHGLAGKGTHPLVERAVEPHRVVDRDPVVLTELEVVLAEGDRVWTTPVPSSVVTKSAVSTEWPRSPKSVMKSNGGS